MAEKVAIIDSLIDESIKRRVTFMEVELFHEVTDFENYVQQNPTVLNKLIITENSLPLSSSSIMRIEQLLKQPFLKIDIGCYYFLKKDTDVKPYMEFITNNALKLLSVGYTPEIITEYLLDNIERESTVNDNVVTYRTLASDYARRQLQNESNNEDASKSYESVLDFTLEDDITLPKISYRNVNSAIQTFNVVGADSQERDAFVSILAQYLSITGRVILVEENLQYHPLYYMLARSKVEFQMYDVRDAFSNLKKFCSHIRGSSSKIVLISTKSKLQFDYNFLHQLIISQVGDIFDYTIRTYDLKNIPYHTKATVILPSTMPEILSTLDKGAKYIPTGDKVVMVSIGRRIPLQIAPKELKRTLLDLQRMDADVPVNPLRIYNLNLVGGENRFDIHSIIAT